MSESSSRSGFGALGLFGLVGTVASFCNTASFVGWAGFAKALLVGAGTSMGATLVGWPLAVIAGLLVTGFTDKKLPLAAALVIAGGGGAVYGAVNGYDFATSALTQQACAVSFNSAADKTSASAPAAPYVLRAKPLAPPPTA